MLKAVIFDIDGTLYDYHAAHARAFEALTDRACRAYGLTPERFEALHGDADRLLRQRCGHSAAIHNRLIRYQVILELLGRSIADAPGLADLYWNALIDAMEPYPGLHEAFSAIHGMGAAIGIGTNMTADWQYAKLERLGILRQVDFMVTSEEAGAEKPDRRLFDLCAQKAGCAPSECAFVGDSLKGDVLGARAAGMRPVWFDPDHRAVEDIPDVHRIDSLADLPVLLSKEF